MKTLYATVQIDNSYEKTDSLQTAPQFRIDTNATNDSELMQTAQMFAQAQLTMWHKLNLSPESVRRLLNTLNNVYVDEYRTSRKEQRNQQHIKKSKGGATIVTP